MINAEVTSLSSKKLMSVRNVLNEHKGGCVYILTNKNQTVFYTEVTSNLTERVWQHRNKAHSESFTARYNCIKLVYYQFYARIEEAIAVEKLIKGGNRQSKIELIKSLNPNWEDLYDNLF